MPWPPKHLDQAGVELEGGWDQPPAYRMHHDGSVTVHAPYVGEVSSPPMSPEKVLEWLVRDDIYPTTGNDSCGLHVHVSTKYNSDYAELMEKEFELAFLDCMEKWAVRTKIPKEHVFWKRLNGDKLPGTMRNYAERKFIPRQQYRVRGEYAEERYTQLNFAALNKYGTLECRMLPMFQDPRQARSAVKAFLKCVDDFIESKTSQEEEGVPLVRIKIEQNQKDLLPDRIEYAHAFSI